MCGSSSPDSATGGSVKTPLGREIERGRESAFAELGFDTGGLGMAIMTDIRVMGGSTTLLFGSESGVDSGTGGEDIGGKAAEAAIGEGADDLILSRTVDRRPNQGGIQV